MAFLDFIKNRGGQEQTTDAQTKPENAKQMYAREAVQEQAAAKPAQSLGPDQQAKVTEARDLFRQASQPSQVTASPAPSSQADDVTAPQPMAQLSMNQDKAAPALSPTSAQSGTRDHEHENPTPAKTPARERPTMARQPPSWER